MADFTVVVEVEFTGGVWTDISAYVRIAEGIQIRRGRGDEQGEIQPGTMTLTLINDGRFTPGRAASPYYPNVRKGRRIRASVVVSAVTYRRFDGYVNEWPVAWEGGTALSLVSITCTDLFKRLGALAPMRSLLEEEMLYLAPDAYYPLGEPSGATSAGDISGRGQRSMAVFQVAGAGGTVDFGGGDGPGTDDLPAPDFAPFSSTQGKGLRANLNDVSGGAVIACWLTTATAGRDFLALTTRVTGLGGAAAVAGIDNGDGTLRVTAANGDSYLVGGFSSLISTNLADGKSHFVALYVRADGFVNARVDTIQPAPALGYGSTLRTDVYDRLQAGGWRDSVSGFANLYDGVVSHVWFRRGAMPSWGDVWSAGNGLTESTIDRFARLCRLLGITGTVLGSSTTQIDPQAAGGKAPVEALRDVAAVEGGLVYASRSAAEVVLECRAWRYNKASALTLTVNDIGGDLVWSDDDQPLLNDCTNKRDSGADQRVTDAASIAAYGIYDGGDTQPWASDYDALAAAQWAVYKGADPPPRITQVTVMANALAAHTSVLGLDLSDVITLSGMPATAPVSSVALHVEGYDESISHNLHTITLNTSPAAPGLVWQIGTAGRSELGTTTRIAL